MKPLLFALLLLATPAAAQTPAASPGHPGWTGTAEGCFVWNPFPQLGETASWSGGCVAGRSSGQGVLIWRSGGNTGGRYVGNMHDGNANGRGVNTWTNGDSYEGEWRDGKRHGRGVYTWTNGDRYEGEYRDDKRNGRGVYIGTNGNRYDGEYRDNKRNGRGIFTWADGRRFDGEWRDDIAGDPAR